MTVEGRAIGDVFAVFTIGGVIVAVIVWSLATWALLRYRRRDGSLPTQTRGNTIVEAVWTLVPLVTVIFLFILTVGTLRTVDASDPGAIHVDVLAFRWGWQATYTGTGRVVVGVGSRPAEFVLPVGEPVEIRLTAMDVNHAFFVPAFLFKRDAIPGRPSTFQLRIDTAGSYPGACAEYCGIGHDAMPFVVRAVPPDQFQAWLAGGSLPASPAPIPAATP